VLWLTLQWGILPNLHRWREPIEQHASRTLGLPVTIGAIHVRPSGFMPDIELSDVVVRDASRREALRLPSVSARPSARSLVTLRPHFARLEIASAMLDVRRDAQGRLHVAGIDLGQPRVDPDSGLHPADWLFEQREVVVRDATVRWTDERRGAPTLALDDVGITLRNRVLVHEADIAATPPRDWGDRFALRAAFTQPFVGDIGFAAGGWRSWSGGVEVDLPRADAAQLRRYVDLPFHLDAGRGSAKAQVEIVRGELRRATADVALADVALRWTEGLAPWDIARLDGRMVMQRSADATRVALEGFGFTTPDGRAWPRGDLALTLRGPAQAPTGGELDAQRIDLALLALLTTRAPLGARQRALIESMQPRGHAERLLAAWDGPLDAPAAWRLRASVQGLSLREQDVPLVAELKRQQLGRPGVEGAAIDLDATDAGGRATMRIERGAASFPGVFERPRIAFDRLDAALRWTVVTTGAAPEPPRMVEVKVDSASFANADMQGRFEAVWTSGDAPDTTPGTLDLDAHLERGRATAVARYLPLGLPEQARRYVEHAILDGRIAQSSIRVKGDLRRFPFTARARAGQAPSVANAAAGAATNVTTTATTAATTTASGRGGGLFRIVAKVADGRMNLAPDHHADDGTSPLWPVLEQINGELVFDGTTMQVRRAAARVEGVALSDVQGDVDFAREVPSVLSIGGRASGAASDMLRYVRASPVDGWIGHALGQATATGAAGLNLALSLPLKQLETSTVRGTLALSGNDLRIRPDMPLLANARGQVDFTEKGLRVGESVARVYDGEVIFQGGSRDDGTIGFTGEGTISHEGLAQARPELGDITNLAAVMHGRAPYRLELLFRAGQPEFTVTSTLEGMAVDLPAPLAKPAHASLPLRVATTLEPRPGTKATHDVLRIEAGSALGAHYRRDITGAAPRVVWGGVGVGAEAPRPTAGVHAAVKAPALDLDAWRRAAAVLGIDLGGPALSPASTKARAAHTPLPAARARSDDAAEGYAPRAVALEVDDLRVDARRLSRVTAGLTQDAQGAWRATLEADQLSGFAQWRPAARGMPPRLQARLARLSVPASASESVEALLSDDAPEQPPALDIVIDDFELRGRKLGRVEVLAEHERAGSGALVWSLERLAVTTPEARLIGSGRWVAATDGSRQRRTVVDFQLDLADSGAYLARFGLPEVLRGGTGRLAGQISWAGSPITWHAPSLGGSIQMDIAAGQFMKAGPGAARLLGVLNLQSLPRRLMFDFRDVFSDGFAFDSITGDVRIVQGRATTNNVRMRGVQAVVLMEGSADVPTETQDLRVWVVPEIDAGTASLAYAAINPAVGLGTFLAQLFLRRPLMEASTREFTVRGSWDDPQVVRLDRKSGDRIPDLDPSRAVVSPTADAAPDAAVPGEGPRPEKPVAPPPPPSAPSLPAPPLEPTGSSDTPDSIVPAVPAVPAAAS
jgi:uncharacterized protein YhdP